MKKNDDFVQKRMRLSVGEIIWGIFVMYAIINFVFMIIALLMTIEYISNNVFIIEMFYWGSFIIPIITLVIALIVNRYSKYRNERTNSIDITLEKIIRGQK